ncbi:MAG: DNA-processing protein DprA [Oscillospiraceae bacterium]
MDESIYWAWLTIGAFGSLRTWTLLRTGFSPGKLYRIVKNGENPGFTPAEFKKLRNTSLHKAEYVLSTAKAHNINVYTPDDYGYPSKLLNIANPPAMLFSYGSLEDISISPSVAVIGSRSADDYALYAANTISRQLADKGITIISGFAKGIDSCAHNATLNAAGQTLAVLGCGIEYDYPHGTMPFKRRIAENGAVISEFFPAAEPKAENFKIRNRIISALSDGILVISAGKHSGTLNTVSHALDQGKDIFVLAPHDVFSGSYDGNIALLRDGATPVYSSADIFNSLKTEL